MCPPTCCFRSKIEPFTCKAPPRPRVAGQPAIRHRVDKRPTPRKRPPDRDLHFSRTQDIQPAPTANENCRPARWREPAASHSSGGDEGIRTPGLCHAKAALSQLSHIPVLSALVIVAVHTGRVNAATLKTHRVRKRARRQPPGDRAPRVRLAPTPASARMAHLCKVGARIAFTGFPNKGGYPLDASTRAPCVNESAHRS